MTAIEADGATTPVCESHIYRMHTLTRRLCLALDKLDTDYARLLDHGLIRRANVHELESLPVLMDLAAESAREMLGLVEGMENAL